jgi:hypothetical protein
MTLLNGRLSNMNKYQMIDEIKSDIQKIENYRDETFVYAHLVGIMSAHLTDEQVADIHRRLKDELDIKEMSDELKYEMEAGK